MILSRQVLSLSLGAWMLVACSQDEGPPTAGVLMDFAKVCDKANDGKRVAAAGYARFPESFSLLKTKDKDFVQSVVLRLYQVSAYTGTPLAVQIGIGTQPNQIEMPPKQYSDKDIKIRLANGQIVGAGTKVKVSGKVYFPVVGQNFSCGLSKPFVELAE